MDDSYAAMGLRNMSPEADPFLSLTPTPGTMPNTPWGMTQQMGQDVHRTLRGIFGAQPTPGQQVNDSFRDLGYLNSNTMPSMPDDKMANMALSLLGYGSTLPGVK